MTHAKVIRLSYRSLDMLDPEEVSRDEFKRPAAITGRLLKALGESTCAVLHLPPGLKLFSPVLAALLAFQAEARKAGGEVVLAFAEERHQVAIEVLGLAEHLPRFETIEAALAERGWVQAGEVLEVTYEILD